MGMKARGSDANHFRWNGRWLMSYGDIAEAMTSCRTEKDAESFKKAYIEFTTKSIAMSNMGYLLGYLSEKEARRLHKIFKVDHPILGGPGGYDSSPQEAFEKGKEMGKCEIDE